MFLADENVDRIVVLRLRSDGWDVVWVAEMEPGLPDEAVLERANREQRVLVTEDKDFGELVFRQSRLSAGVLLLRLAGLDAARKADAVSAALTKHQRDMLGRFTVIAPGRIRIRSALPG